MSRVEAEFGLDGGRVHSVFVKAIADGTSKLHVSCGTFALEIKVDLDVQAGDKLGVAQLPDVDVMAADDAWQHLNVSLNVINVQTQRDSLQEDTGGGLAERNGRTKDDDGDDERNGRISVETPRVVGKPDEKRSCNNTNVSEGISHDMEEDAAHVEVPMRMPVATLGRRVLWLVMVV